MAYSKLAKKRISTPNYNPRTQKITKITIHHMAGVMTGEQCANIFKSRSRQASANYCIGNNGDIVACADETTQRAWTSGSEWNDQRAVTIEVSNNKVGGQWTISKKAYDALIDLCADICKRHKITPSYNGKTTGTLTEHRMYQATACPGAYIHNLLVKKTVENDIKKKLAPKPTPTPKTTLYKVQVGAYKNKANADALLAKLKKKAFSGVIVVQSGLYKVQVGAYKVKANAESQKKLLKLKGFSGVIVEVKQ